MTKRLTILVLVLLLLLQHGYYTGMGFASAHQLIESLEYLTVEPEDRCVEIGNNICITLED